MLSGGARKWLGMFLCFAIWCCATALRAENRVTLNFSDTDINAVIAAVSEMTGRNFIVDPRVKGKVTVISKQPLDSKEVYSVFLSVLKVHGFAAIEGKNVTKIVPEVDAKQEAVRTSLSRPGDTDEFITQVMEIRNVDAAQLVPILRPLVPQRGHLAAFPGSNVLVISDTAANVRRLQRIIANIDRVSGDEIEAISLKQASASEVVRIIQQLAQKDPKQPRGLSVVADERSNSVLVSGNKSERLRIRALVAHLDTPVDVEGNTQVVYLRNAVAKDLVPVLTGVSKSVANNQGKAPKAAASGNDITIQADENTNALVINAPPDVFRSLRSVIKQLDIRRAQVLVEGVIAEVTHNISRELGVQWAADSQNGTQAVGVINFSVGTPITGLLSTPPAIGDGINIGIGETSSSGNRIGALIRALNGDGLSNILATPSLLTLDNQEAEFVVGQNVPFITGSYTSTGTGTTPTNPFQTVQRQDVGLTLRIKPQINEGNAIKLQVEQEVSNITPSTQGVDIITNKRSLKTNVIVEDGQMIVLGGLIQDDLRESEQRVPGLGDIPLLGWLFRYNKTEKVKTNLMIFLHPVILKEPALMASFTGDKYNYIRAEQLKMREQGLSLIDDDEAPVLEEFSHIMTLPPPYQESAVNAGDAASGIPPTLLEAPLNGKPASASP